MSGAQTIRLLLADVDGTLLTKDKVLTGAAKEVGSCATRHCVRHHQRPAATRHEHAHRASSIDR